MIPGEYKLSKDPIDYNAAHEAISLEVVNKGDRAVQVGSHFHFYEANMQGLSFDRDKAWGKRLDIAAGTAIRFEPGQKHTVNLIDYAGYRRVYGFNAQCNGYLDRK